jgi:hypothetical protein
MKKALLLMSMVLLAGALPANATTITIDSSTGCTACYGLSWTLTINSAGGYMLNGTTYGYQAILSVTDDPNVAGTPSSSLVISAVDFKVSNTVLNGALYSFPTSSSGWSTSVNALNSAGCTGANAGFVCSQSATDPANFTSTLSTLAWGWYFNTTDPIFAGLGGAHIGAKLTDLANPGQLLSQTYSVPESRTMVFLALGLLMFVVTARRTGLDLRFGRL